MKKVFAVFALTAISTFQFSCASRPDKGSKAALETNEQKYSYMIGLDMGKSLSDLDFAVDLNSLKVGIADIIEKRNPQLSDSAVKALQTQFMQELQKKRAEKAQKAVSDNAKFFETNKTKPGVMTTPSGLQYEIITMGTGPKPLATDTVQVHYEGSLLDGKIFDSSKKRGQPVTFPLNQVIPGWTEGIQLMPVGSKFKLYIPPQLGYGEQGMPQGGIGPNSILVFEVELLEVHSAKASEAAPSTKKK